MRPTSAASAAARLFPSTASGKDYRWAVPALLPKRVQKRVQEACYVFSSENRKALFPGLFLVAGAGYGPISDGLVPVESLVDWQW
jgi:hypothetical protein